MTNMEDPTGQGDALRTVVLLKGLNLRSDLVDTDVVTGAGVRLSKAVHVSIGYYEGPGCM